MRSARTRRPPRRDAKTRRWVIGVLVALVLLVIAGPTLLSLTPIPASLVAGALPPEAGSVSAESVGLSWAGPVTVAGVELSDPGGAVVAKVGSARVGGGLLALASQSGPLEVTVEGVRADVVIDADGGTNLDPIIRALEDARGDEAEAAGADGAVVAKPRRPLRVTLRDAAVRLTDAATGARWVAEGIDATIDDPARGVNALRVTAGGELATLAGPDAAATPERARFQVEVGPADGGAAASGRLRVERAPLAVVSPLLRRSDPQADLAGWADLSAEATWDPSAPLPENAVGPAAAFRTLLAGGVRVVGEARLSAVVLRTAATRGDPVRLASVVAPIAARAAGDRLLIESAEAISDIGKLSVSGSIGVSDVDRWASGVSALPSDLRVRGDVELAALGRSAPGALAIREGSRIDAGRVTADVRMNDGRVEAAADLAGLAGVAGGRRVAWDQPVSLRVRATHSIAPGAAAPWRLDSLTLDSRFASATATGEGDTLTGELRADLDRLAAELRPLFDLGATRLAGQGAANYRVRRDPASGAWALDAQGSVERLLVGDAERPLVDEPRLDVRAKVSGPATVSGPSDISGRIDVTAGADLLVIEAPTASNGNAARKFTATLSGDAARWYRRVRVARPDLPAGEAIGLAGAVRVEARGEASPDRAQVDRLSVALSGLTLDTASVGGAPRVRLRDERVELGGAARWDAPSGAVRLRDAELVSSVASARVGEAMLSINDPPSSRGEAAFRVDLAGVNRWTPPRAGPPTHAASGSVTGTATLRGVPEGLNILAAATGENLTLTRLAPRGSPTGGTPPNGSMVVWSEPSLRVDLNAIATPIAAAGGRPATVSVEVRDVRVASQTLSGSAGGKIEDAVGLRGVRLGGGVDYDLAMVTALLAPRTGGAVKLAGRDRATFRIESVDDAPADAPPLTRLTGELAAPWEGAEVFGLPIGPGRLAATLEGGVVRTDPLAVAVGQGGRIDLAALARLHPVPGSVSLRPGPLVSDVALSAEVTERVLKFIAPVLADATRIDGRFSLGLEEFVAPLSPPDPRDPRSTALATRAAGALDIQSVRVLPGPGVAEWVALVDQIRRTAEEGVEAIASVGERPLVEIRQSRVPFRMVNGRIEHTGLEFAIGDAVVQSSGSVGVDETLDLVLRVPIQEDWIEDRPVLLGRMRGQSLTIPVRGTFSDPKIDRDAFRNLSRELLQSAAQGAIEGGLQLLFDRLKSR